MKRIYCIRRTSYLGNYVKLITYTNLKKAKSYAYQWINRVKRFCKTEYGCRDYGQLKAMIYYVDDFGREVCVKEYR